MLVDATIFSAFLVGLLGGVHCVGMCGGIVGAFSMQLSRRGYVSGRQNLNAWLLYHGGRLLSYSVAGVLAGGLGDLFLSSELRYAQHVLLLLAGLMMVALGLYLAGWWFGLEYIERLGSLVWKRIQPLSGRLTPALTPARMILMGVLWGWLPCGLVYSVLIWALSAGSMAQGGLLMLAFGLGTLPLMLTISLSATHWFRRLQHPAVRRVAGALVMAYGMVLLFNVYKISGGS